MRIRIGNMYFADLKQLKIAITKGKIEIDKEVSHNMNEYCISLLSSLTDQYFYTEAKNRGGYKNMGEILYDSQANPPDPDAVFLKNLYDAVWEKEEELEQELQKMGLEELLNLDLQKWAYEQYNQVKNQLEEGAGA